MLSGQWLGLCFYDGMDAGGTATTECPPNKGSGWKHESPDFSRGESQYNKAWSLGGHESEEDVEERLMNWKTDVLEGLEKGRLVDAAVEVLMSSHVRTFR